MAIASRSECPRNEYRVIVWLNNSPANTENRDCRERPANGEVAQLVEQGAVNTQVKGSIPFFSAI
jgi:hypothetical protein